ncbi:Methylosome subunit pICln [Eumeta japonica]|uniref:Methylosome subunit pICln n=1 Tax=Eumeta variegata TaxID=151549 RepID=A0A4C1SWT0_EUMVA|nr:Methylosome subunit pICln [Eumeta japonica]
MFNVVWGGGVTSSGTAVPTISLLYPNISLHAVQRLPTPALYMILNYDLRVPGLNSEQSGQDDDIDDDFDPEETPITQLRFVPQNEADLQTMYSAMSQGQSLHPDAADVEEDEPYMDGEEFDEHISGDDEFEDAEESESAAGDDAAARLRQLRLENANGHHQAVLLIMNMRLILLLLAGDGDQAEEFQE